MAQEINYKWQTRNNNLGKVSTVKYCSSIHSRSLLPPLVKVPGIRIVPAVGLISLWLYPDIGGIQLELSVPSGLAKVAIVGPYYVIASGFRLGHFPVQSSALLGSYEVPLVGIVHEVGAIPFGFHAHVIGIQLKLATPLDRQHFRFRVISEEFVRVRLVSVSSGTILWSHKGTIPDNRQLFTFRVVAKELIPSGVLRSCLGWGGFGVPLVLRLVSARVVSMLQDPRRAVIGHELSVPPTDFNLNIIVTISAAMHFKHVFRTMGTVVILRRH